MELRSATPSFTGRGMSLIARRRVHEVKVLVSEAGQKPPKSGSLVANDRKRQRQTFGLPLCLWKASLSPSTSALNIRQAPESDLGAAAVISPQVCCFFFLPQHRVIHLRRWWRRPAGQAFSSSLVMNPTRAEVIGEGAGWTW